MGRKRSGGGGSGSGVKSPSIMDRVLTRDIENLKKNNNYATVEELVDHLRSAYPRYARHKLLPFTKCVNQIASSLGREEVRNDDSDSNDDNTLTKKKRRKIDPGEEKLRAIEAQHIKSRSGNVLHNSSASSSIASTASSGSSSEEDESSDKEASTSDDAIFGKKFKPEFDLMSSMLRQNYVQKSKNVSEPKEAREALELEVVENKDRRKVSLVNEGAKQAGVGGDGLGEFSRNGNKNNGPLFKDLGGMGGVIEQLKREVVWPLYSLKVLRHLGVKPMAGVLLHGPPGCGKTKLAHALANETNVPFYKISATELVSGVSGASEENIRELFSKAYRTAPSIIFIDEIDAIASKRENVQREMERRIVTQLMTCMDESHRVVKPDDGNGDSESSDHNPGHVIVIGATNRPDAVDPALRRPGRFDREIMLGVPDERARVEILSVLVSDLKVEGSFDLLKIARSTPGFVGADLAELTNKAGNLAFNRILDEREAELSNKQVDKEDSEEWWKHPWSNEEMERLNITMADFEEAAKFVQPSSRREGFSTIPNVKWDDVGGLHLLRQEFERDIVRRIKYPEYYENVGVPLETGFLLYGPPGCGKTLIAKAVANEAGANFIHIKGPEILNKYVGESELAVRKIFSRARTCSPCILFFDEVDAITTMRGREGGWVVERLLTQLLIELDGAEQRRGVFVIGATNRPEVMDRAFLRPGRFGKLFYVPLPTPDERGMILKAVARKNPVDATVDLMAIAKDNACENLSGADLSNLMREAINVALDEEFTLSGGSLDGKSWTIKDVHFKRALEKISPSVSNEQIRFYQRLSQSFKAA